MEKRRGGKEEWEMLIHMRATTTTQHRHTLARVPGRSLPPSPVVCMLHGKRGKGKLHAWSPFLMPIVAA